MIRKWLAALVLGLCVAHSALADRVERIEPLSWWVGMKDDRLQLMVHGDRIAGLEPALQYPGVAVESVERVANPNYLFINLRIAPDTRPGEFAIDFLEGRRKAASRTYVLNAREPGSAQRAGFGPQDTIYLVMPDRFANGDPSNDTVKGLRDGLDRDEPFGRHGGDLQGIVNHLDYVAGMGFTQLWLNPVLENAQPSITYHGYAITDFYKVDPRLGTNEEYRQLAAEARRRGIGLIKDVVLNHCGSGHWWMKDPPTPDWFNMGGKFVPTHHVREALQDPHAAEVDRVDFTDGWFVETMPDMNQRNPYLATYLIQHTLWWTEYAGLSGLRIDTYPYSDRGFLTEWSRRVTEEYPNLNVVGEEWSGNPVTVSYWQRGRNPPDGYVSYLPGLFDFPLHEAVLQGLQEKEDWGTGLRRIYRVLAVDALYPDPYNLVVFPDNHDVNRMFTVLGDRADLQRMALAFFLTTRGIPQVFYGTELLMASPGPKNDGVIRSDFPGGWAGDRRNAFTGAGLTEAERSMQDYTRALLQWRRTAPAMRDGKLTHYVPFDGIYVYFRHDAAQTVMVVMNNNDDARVVDTQRFREVLRDATQGIDVVTKQVHDVTRSIEVPARSVTILELNRPEPLPVTGPGVTGTVFRYAAMPSAHVEARNVDVWLPPGYDSDPDKRYPVLYMHDGQNLFDPATSYGNVDWAVDEAMTRLIEQGEVREAIVVGIWNTPKRFQEYMPQRAVQGTNKIRMPGFDVKSGEVISDRYLAFLVTELKPFIDARYRTLPDRANTTVMGSSMGGLISQYAMSKYPGVFGGAGCVSTHWPAGDGIALDDFAAHLPDPATHRYWFDFGTATLDASYEPYQRRADEILRKAGYVEGENWVTKKFEGAEHSEKAWRLRVDQPLEFLIGR